MSGLDWRHSCVLGTVEMTFSVEEGDMHLNVVPEAVMDRRHRLLSLLV